ncbi:hypothetical protein SCUCBS95973_009985 [Sporothrix curviconia]|uniref:Uncharacterized protein n=1 Tax=Sporothrix curviconia TaxID=1260050 RepID=A0ABP0D229_9PEZI
MNKAARDGYPRPFPVCVRAGNLFGGACSNCKWPDAGAACSLVHGESVSARGQAGSASNPLVLDEDQPPS